MRTRRAILSLLLLPLALLPARAGQLPVRNYTTADGLVHERVRCIVRDSRGFLWFCTGDGLSRFDGYSFTNYGVPEGLTQPAVNQLVEGRGGVYWLATAAGVALFDPSAGRAQPNAETRPPIPAAPASGKSRFTFFKIGDDEVSNRVQTILADSAGRVWAGTQSGLYFADESADGRRVFRRIELPAPPEAHAQTPGDVSPAAFVNSLLEDAEGSVWVGASTGLFRHTSDGRVLAYAVAPNGVSSLGTDREGRLWVGFGDGLAVVRPEPLAALVAPVAWRVKSTREETHWPDGRLRLPEAEGEACVYGADEGLTRNSVWAMRQTGDGRVWILTRYAGLLVYDGGRLRRYTNEQGLLGNIHNAVEVDAAGNVWVGTESYGALKIARRRERVRAEDELRRAKEERLAELERVRKRIATDLHDDIGSSLTQIAVLSEVARQRAGAGAEQLAQISAVSNELVESMSDIVWAINPKKDRLSDLTQRMRRFASDIFTARGVRFHFDAPFVSAADGDLHLGADLRREVFLIFKESVNNVVKHSGATSAEVEFRLAGGELLLRVKDDGRGFDASGAGRSGEYERTVGGAGGNGLDSLFRRARELGGEYEVRSAPGAGTTISLRIPVGPPRAGSGDSHYPNGW
jgi:signal transduction histidine kinase